MRGFLHDLARAKIVYLSPAVRINLASVRRRGLWEKFAHEREKSARELAYRFIRDCDWRRKKWPRP